MVTLTFLDSVEFREFDGVRRPIIDIDLFSLDGNLSFSFPMVLDTATQFTPQAAAYGAYGFA